MYYTLMVPRNPIIQVLCFVYRIYTYLYTDGCVYTHNYVEEREGVVLLYCSFTKCQKPKHFIKINVEQKNDRDKQN